jgi:hypothetical protein
MFPVLDRALVDVSHYSPSRVLGVTPLAKIRKEKVVRLTRSEFALGDGGSI